MRTMSTRYQPARGWGWLLLLGGLAACGNDVPWMAADAAGPEGRGLGEPGIGDAPDPELPDAELAMTGVFGERFVEEGYGAAWTLRTADLDADGTRELLYGGHGVVAIGQDDTPRWTFALPALAEAMKEKKIGKEADEQSQDARRLGFLGVHVREIRVSGENVFVLDSANRVHVLNASDGTLQMTKNLAIEGKACDFALFDGDGDDVADYFPSGGKVAYSGKTGEALFEADIDFEPALVRTGELGGDGGREIVLVRGSEDASDLCPADENVLLAMKATKAQMHGDDAAEEPEGVEQEREPRLPRDENRDEGRDDDREDDREPRGEASVYVLDAKGQALYEGGQGLRDIHTALIVPMEGGDGMLVVADAQRLTAIGPMGEQLWNANLANVEQILLADLNGDGNPELLAHAIEGDTSTLHGLDADGKTLWSAPLDGRIYALEVIDLDGDDQDELLTSMGTMANDYTAPKAMPDVEAGVETDPKPAAGFARTTAWRVGAQGPEEMWSADEYIPARGFAGISGEDGNALYVAGGDATLHRHDALSGEQMSTWNAGSLNHAVGAGDLDGDGAAEVIAGDIFGNLRITNGKGGVAKNVKLDSDGLAVVTGIAVAEDDQGRGILLATGYAWNSPDKGILQGFDAEGNTVFTQTTKNALGDVKVADLDGNGTNEVVVAQFPLGMRDQAREDDREQGREQGREQDPEQQRDPQMNEQACGVVAFDLAGQNLWETDVASCAIARIEVGDINDDGAYEVAYGDLGQDGPFHVALLDGGTGEVRFDTISEDNDAVWLAVVDGGVAYGGRAGDKGHVTLLDARGEEVWSVDAGGKANAPEMEDAPFGAFAGSLFGTVVDDIDGDGKRDLAYSTVDGDLFVASSETGEPLFEASIADGMKRGNEPARDARDDGYARSAELFGGPVVYLAGAKGAGTLVVSGYDFEGVRSTIVAFDVQDGKAIGTLDLPGFVAGITSAKFDGGGKGIAIATTYDTYGIDVKAKGGRTPLPDITGALGRNREVEEE